MGSLILLLDVWVIGEGLRVLLATPAPATVAAGADREP
jgi:hypothetical protein